MQATITKRFQIAREGHTVDTYDVGDVVSGLVARTAVEMGYALELGTPELETKPAAPKLEKKPAKKRATTKQGAE